MAPVSDSRTAKTGHVVTSSGVRLAPELIYSISSLGAASHSNGNIGNVPLFSQSYEAPLLPLSGSEAGHRGQALVAGGHTALCSIFGPETVAWRAEWTVP